MSRYNENECAYCAEDVEIADGLIGCDWKVYCSERCRVAGEAASQLAFEQWQQRGQTSAMAASHHDGVAANFRQI
jgi:hypothetical protein